MKKKSMIKNRIKCVCVCVYDFSVDYRAFDASIGIDTNNYLMKKHDIK